MPLRGRWRTLAGSLPRQTLWLLFKGQQQLCRICGQTLQLRRYHMGQVLPWLRLEPRRKQCPRTFPAFQRWQLAAQGSSPWVCHSLCHLQAASTDCSAAGQLSMRQLHQHCWPGRGSMAPPPQKPPLQYLPRPSALMRLLVSWPGYYSPGRQ